MSYIIYLICFIPYLLLLRASIFGVELGFFGNTSTYYGWDAIVIQGLALCFVPVLPAAALYQVIFLILRGKRLSSRQKKVSRALILSIAGALILSCVICCVLTAIHSDKVYEQDKAIIEAYLREEFGEEYAAEMEVLRPDTEGQDYYVKTPVIESDFLVCVNETHMEVYACCFCEAYVQETGLQTLLSRKLVETYDVPADTELNVVIRNISYQAAMEQDLESLLDSCEYELASVYFNTERYDREEVLERIRRFYTDYGRELLKHCESSSLSFYVREQQEFYASIQAIRTDREPEVCHLYIQGYTYSDGITTVPYEELEISLEP